MCFLGTPIEGGVVRSVAEEKQGEGSFTGTYINRDSFPRKAEKEIIFRHSRCPLHVQYDIVMNVTNSPLLTPV